LGVLALIALVSLAVVVVASVGTWRYLRREVVGSEVAAPVAVRVPIGPT
jgi:hypothetical protein